MRARRISNILVIFCLGLSFLPEARIDASEVSTASSESIVSNAKHIYSHARTYLSASPDTRTNVLEYASELCKIHRNPSEKNDVEKYENSLANYLSVANAACDTIDSQRHPIVEVREFYRVYFFIKLQMNLKENRIQARI